MLTGIERIQIISIIGSFVFLLGVLELIRIKLIKEAYALLWLLFGAIFILLSFWKQGLDFLAGIVGIYYPPALLFLMLIIAIILILIQFSVVISKNNDSIKNLTQELALLQNQIADLRKKKNRE